jgi:hypothetical protein
MMFYAEPAILNRKHLTVIAFFIILNFVLLFSFQSIVPYHVVLFLLLFFVWCSPGYLFARIASKAQTRRGLFFWILTIVAGYHLSSILTVLIVHSFSVPMWIVALFIAGLALAGFLIFHNRLAKDAKNVQLPRLGIDLLPFGILLAFVLLFLFLVLHPYSQAGKPVAEGFQYHELFSTVFFKHMSITGELARAEIPPENPFFVGQKLNYYWLFHVFPSIVHSSLNIPLEETLFLLTWVVSIIALFAILILIHAFATRTSDLILGVTPLLFAYSYDGVLVLAHLTQESRALGEFSSMNIDAAGRTYLDSPEVIGIYRAFVFDPHHMFAICLMVVTFLLFRRALYSQSKIAAACGLVLLGGIAGHSAFIAYTAILWILLWLMVEVFRGQASFFKDFKFLSFAALVVLGYAIFYFRFPGLFEIGKSDISFSLSPHSTLFVLLDFGALLILGSLGLFLGIKKKDWRILPLAVLILVGFVQLFFTYFPLWPHDLSMKTGHSIYIALACLGAHFFSKQASGSYRRRLATVAFAVISIPAIPTLIMDWYSLQQTENKNTTTLVTHDDLEACEWIDKNLSEDSVVQSYPVRDGSAFYSIIPTFAQRRTALGDMMHSRIFQGDLERNRSRRKLINLMFLTNSSELAWMIAKNLDVEYIYVGTAERRLFLDKLAKFRDDHFFRRAYAKNRVKVFQVLPENDVSKQYVDSYDEQTDTSVVHAALAEGFVEMKNLDYWNPLQWTGTSGATMYLNSLGEFAGVLLFRIYVAEPVRLEMRAGPLHGIIELKPGWRWIELNELDLEKGQTQLQFNLKKSKTKTFQISEVIFFGKKLNDSSNPLME